MIIHCFVRVRMHARTCFAFHNHAGHLIINTHAPLAVSRLSHTFKSPHGASGHSEKWNIYIWTDVLLSTMYGFMQSLNKWNALWTAQTTFQNQMVALTSKMYLGMEKWCTPASPNSWQIILTVKINCSQVAYCPVILVFYLYQYCTNGTHRTRVCFSWICYKTTAKATPRSQTTPWECLPIIWFLKSFKN